MAAMASRLRGAVAASQAYRTYLQAQHGAIFRRSLSQVATEDEVPAEKIPNYSVKELVEKGMKEFQRLELAYENIDPADVTFTVGQNFRSNPVPEISYKGKKRPRGLEHVAPWSVVYFAKMGMKGNLGEIVYGSNVERTDPGDAQVQIGLSIRARHGDEEQNDDLLKYITWLKELESKFCDHIASNLDAYPKLNAKFAKNDEFLKHMLTMSMSHKSERFRKDEKGNNKEGIQYVIAVQDLFRKSFSPVSTFECAYDAEVYAAHQLVRRKVPMFDSAQKLIPLSENPVERSFIVSCTMNVIPSMFEAFYGLKKTVESVTILTIAEDAFSGRLNPWASVEPFRGGYRYEMDEYDMPQQGQEPL